MCVWTYARTYAYLHVGCSLAIAHSFPLLVSLLRTLVPSNRVLDALDHESPFFILFASLHLLLSFLRVSWTLWLTSLSSSGRMPAARTPCRMEVRTPDIMSYIYMHARKHVHII